MEFTEEQIKHIVEIATALDQSLRRYERYEDPFALIATVTLHDFVGARVGTNRILVITHMSAYDATSACTYIRLGYWNRTRDVWPKIEPAPLVLETVEFNGELYLQEGMWPRIQFNGCAAGDDIYGLIQGYWVRAPRIS